MATPNLDCCINIDYHLHILTNISEYAYINACFYASARNPGIISERKELDRCSLSRAKVNFSFYQH